MSVHLNFKSNLPFLCFSTVLFFQTASLHSVGLKHTNVKLTKLTADSLVRRCPKYHTSNCILISKCTGFFVHKIARAWSDPGEVT